MSYTRKVSFPKKTTTSNRRLTVHHAVVSVRVLQRCYDTGFLSTSEVS